MMPSNGNTPLGGDDLDLDFYLQKVPSTLFHYDSNILQPDQCELGKKQSCAPMEEIAPLERKGLSPKTHQLKSLNDDELLNLFLQNTSVQEEHVTTPPAFQKSNYSGPNQAQLTPLRHTTDEASLQHGPPHLQAFSSSIQHMQTLYVAQIGADNQVHFVPCMVNPQSIHMTGAMVQPSMLQASLDLMPQQNVQQSVNESCNPSLLETMETGNLPWQMRHDPELREFYRKRLERQVKIERYKAKKRNWRKKVAYVCRKKVAEKRLRIKGRFLSKEDSKRLVALYGDDAHLHLDEVDKFVDTHNNLNIERLPTEVFLKVGYTRRRKLKAVRDLIEQNGHNEEVENIISSKLKKAQKLFQIQRPDPEKWGD